MKTLVIAMTAGGVALAAIRVHAQESINFSADDYGAVANDGGDDRQAIQSALNAAGAAGGGTVQLSAGVYHVVVVYDRGYGPVSGYSNGLTGYVGLQVPPGCTLTGTGRESTTVRILAGAASPFTVGDGIINAGYQTALTDFGGGGNIRISHLRVDTPDTTVAPTGILIGMAHADGVTLSSVAVGASLYHGVEINLSRNVVLEDCVFDGEHAGSSTLQLDMGGIGAKSRRPTGTVIRDVLVRRCRFLGRSAELYGKVIELGHTSSTCIVRNVAFEDCYIESIGGPTSACVTNDSPAAQEFTGLRFERCQFHGVQPAPSANGLLQLTLQNTQTLDGLIVRDCRFTGVFWQGLVVISTTPTFNTGHSQRRNILIEGNTFSPVLDRAAPTNGGSMRMIAAAACADIIVRRNLVECPATAANLSLSNFFAGIQVANCLDATVENNVFTWEHASAAAAPMGKSKHIGIVAPVYQLEQSALQGHMTMTGNVFLYPVNGIGSAINMTTTIPTTSWAPGGPWVSGLMAGNFASGAGSSTAWAIHHDLSGAANTGQILPANSSRAVKAGWYSCNGAALTSLDSGSNSLARVNANTCGYAAGLPVLPEKVVRLHGPLTGEGLLEAQVARYAGSVYSGTVDSISEITLLPFASLTPGVIRVVRTPLAVLRWEANVWPAGAPPGSWAPADKPADTPGFWMPLNMGVEKLADDFDMDGDGLINREERAFLCDPAVPDSPDVITSSGVRGGPLEFTFNCAAGASSPRICILSSEDMVSWQIETSCQSGGKFQSPDLVTLSESPWKTGRAVTVRPAPSTRRFWRVAVQLSP